MCLYAAVYEMQTVIRNNYKFIFLTLITAYAVRIYAWRVRHRIARIMTEGQDIESIWKFEIGTGLLRNK